jgi:hypothetical protein
VQYISSDPNKFTPPPVWGPDDTFEPPEWFLPTMERIASAKMATPSKPNVMFEMTDTARAYNHDRLAEHDFDLSKLIRANHGSTLDYGSEFRPMSQLELLLGRHPNFTAIKEFIEKGMPFVFVEELDAETMRKELETALEQGNHKSASKEFRAAARTDLQRRQTRVLATNQHCDCQTTQRRDSSTTGVSTPVVAESRRIKSGEDPHDPRPLFLPSRPQELHQPPHRHVRAP